MKIRLERYHTLKPRDKRNQLLADSDWTQLPDTRLTAAQREAWATYREELRAMDLLNPHWPRPPQ